MREFDHYTPQTLPEVLDLIGRLEGRARVIAGGTDLVPLMRAGGLRPEAVINIKRVPDLTGIAFDEQSGLRLGALVTLRELTRSGVVRECYPCLVETASLMASEQIRSFATVGGNLCHASPAADLPPPLIALGARVCVVGPEGERWLPLEDFFLGPGDNALRPGELLKEVHVPPPAGAVIYLKHAPRVLMDLAVVGVAVRLCLAGERCEGVRIALGAVAPVPLRARRAEAELNGQAFNEERIARAAAVAAEECQPIDDVRGAAWYRRRMVELLVRRGLTALVESWERQ